MNMLQSLRQNLNDLIDSSKPQSPTDLIFIFGSLVLLALMVYAAQIRVTNPTYTVPHFEAMLLALGTYKGVKVISDKTQTKFDLKSKEADLAISDKSEDKALSDT